MPDASPRSFSTRTKRRTDASSSLAQLQENFAFVLNVGRLDGIDEAELVPGYLLRAATKAEFDLVKPTMERVWPPGYSPKIWQGEGRTPFVIAFGTQPDAIGVIQELQRAMDIASVEIEIGPVFQRDPRSGSYGPSQDRIRLFHVMEAAASVGTLGFFVLPGTEDVSQIRDLWTRLRADPELTRIVNQLGQLKRLGHQEPLRFLGYFGMLEALLTHKPDPSDPYDSITRQLKKKLALLRNRFQPPLDYAAFGNATHEKIWGAMYSYRSDLAHGGAPGLGRNARLLRDQRTALSLLQSTVKATIRQALLERVLLRDLRDC